LWTTFSRHLSNDNNHPRIITHVNIQLIQLWFLLRKDIMSHMNLNLFSLFNNSTIFFIINIYSDKQQSALKYIKNIEANLNNILIFTRNFNIRNRYWNLSYPFHLVYTDILIDIADSFDLKMFIFKVQLPTYYVNNSNDTNSVINLMFL